MHRFQKQDTGRYKIKIIFNLSRETSLPKQNFLNGWYYKAWYYFTHIGGLCSYVEKGDFQTNAIWFISFFRQ